MQKNYAGKLILLTLKPLYQGARVQYTHQFTIQQLSQVSDVPRIILSDIGAPSLATSFDSID